jgi:ABC-2 type transport system permease protein
MPPLSGGELLIGYLSGALGRGVLISLAMMLGMSFFLSMNIAHPALALGFVLLGSLFLGSLGIMAAIYANKFDQMSTITNFVITPLAFLSGSFYSIEALPENLRQLAYYNPLFYLIDGTRYSILGVSDCNPLTSFAVVTCSVIVVYLLAWRMFSTGYRLKS